MKNTKFSGRILKVDSEYFTFISGSIISIPLSLLFEFKDNYNEWFYWIALSMSLIASVICFHLAVKIKTIQEVWENNMKAVGPVSDATHIWNKTISDEKNKCYLFVFIIIVSLIVSIVCTCMMQFYDSSMINISQATKMLALI